MLLPGGFAGHERILGLGLYEAHDLAAEDAPLAADAEGLKGARPDASRDRDCADTKAASDLCGGVDLVVMDHVIHHNAFTSRTLQLAQMITLYSLIRPDEACGLTFGVSILFQAENLSAPDPNQGGIIACGLRWVGDALLALI